jgi:predicted ABC-type ATPase
VSSTKDHPTCWIIAGPNGAGKTTFALEYLPNVVGCHHFVNADLIAAGIAPLAPEAERVAAGRLFLKEIERYVSAGANFGFETTLAGRAYLRLIQRLRADGWRVELIYLMLPDPEMARLRVAERVAHGGHNIPQADVERRFYRSLANLFAHYLPAVDRTVCLSNESETQEIIFVRQRDTLRVVRKELLDAM